MPSLKCPQCARELAPGAQVCPYDGTPINSVVARPSLWGDDKTITRTNRTETEADDGPGMPALLQGQKLGDYEVGALLGSGGMGEVYAGEQPMIGKKVAIKVLKAEVAAEPGNVQRMLSEARSVNAIRHRSIVDIFNFGTLSDGRPYLVMEYLEGTALDTMLRKQGALIPAEVAEFLEEICSALAAAHGRGIVHRDLKPGNVFIVSDGNTRNRYVKLLDFGLAKGEPSGESTKQTRAGMVVGTPDYIAPEQARGGTITPRTDLYSLGVMAFEMLTGSLPFTAESVVELMMMHVQAPAPHVSSKIDFCPPALDALVYQLMSKEPADRPRSAEGVRQEIARIRREMRESATMIGATMSSLGIVNETIRIPVPEANTPSATPFPESRPEAPAATRVVTPPRASAPAVDATARYVSVQPRETTRQTTETPIAGGRGKLIGVLVVLAALLAGGAYVFFRQPRPDVLLVAPPPVARELPHDPPDQVMVVTPERPENPPRPGDPGVTPVPKSGPKVQVAPKPRPIVAKPVAVVERPTKEELRTELTKLLNHHATVNKKGPAILKTVEEEWTRRINEANSVEARKKLLRTMQDPP
jgi:serine/threonine protein kinase